MLKPRFFLNYKLVWIKYVIESVYPVAFVVMAILLHCVHIEKGAEVLTKKSVGYSSEYLTRIVCSCYRI